MTASITDLHALVAKQARRCYEDPACHPVWEVAAADQVMVQPAVRDLLAAADAVRALRELHQRHAWDESSLVVVCVECRQSWPCKSVQAMMVGA